MGQNIKPFRSDRLFFDSIVSIGYFKNTDAYVDGNPDFPGQRAGSHDSDVDNFITGEGGDSDHPLRFNYLLPIGSGRDRILPAYQLNEGMLTGGAKRRRRGEPFDQRTDVTSSSGPSIARRTSRTTISMQSRAPMAPSSAFSGTTATTPQTRRVATHSP